MPFASPTMCSTSARGLACTAGHRRPGDAGEIIANPESLTGDYLSGASRSPSRPSAPALTGKWLKLKGASGNNLRNVNLDLPIGVMTCVTGVSGSGKSTLINRHPVPHRPPRAEQGHRVHPGPIAASRAGASGQGGGYRPEPHRPHPALQPGHLHRACSPRSASCSPAPRRRVPWLPAGPLLLQREGGRCEACQGTASSGGDALPAGRLRAVRRLQGQALQPRDPGGEVQGQEHPRNPRDDGGRCP